VEEQFSTLLAAEFRWPLSFAKRDNLQRVARALEMWICLFLRASALPSGSGSAYRPICLTFLIGSISPPGPAPQAAVDIFEDVSLLLLLVLFFLVGVKS
jgi:hypothetical protein